MKSLLFTSAKWMTVVSMCGALLAGCGGGQAADPKNPAPNASAAPTVAPAASPAPTAAATTPVEAYKLITDELNKSKDAKPDYAVIQKAYNEQLKALVQKRDSEASENTDQLIAAAIEGSKSGQINAPVAKQIVDKLLQKVFYFSMKASFKDMDTNWAKPDDVKKSFEQAKQYFKPVVENSLKTSDAAFKTTLQATVNTAFADAEKSLGESTSLSFDLARQVIDKTLIKHYYLNVGGKNVGDTYKIEKGIAEGKDVKADQAEAWAYFQSIIAYVSAQAKEEAAMVNKQLELTTDPKTIKADAINAALIRGLAKIGLDEYEQSMIGWGKPKAITAGMEGALFVEVLSQDIARIQGEAVYTSLKDQAQKYMGYAKDGKQEEATAALKQIKTGLEDLIAKAK